MPEEKATGSIFDTEPEVVTQEGDDDVPFLRLSPSQIGAYVRCKFQFYVLYILKYREPGNHNLYFGIQFDNALNFNYEEQMETDKPRAKDETKDYFRERWDKEKDQVAAWEGNDPATLRELGFRGLDAFYEEVIPSVHVEDVQPKLSLTFTNAKAMLVGRPDLIEKAPIIVDNKTTGKTSIPDSYINQSPQASLYPLFFMEDGKPKTQEVRFDILMKKKKPAVISKKRTSTVEEQVAALKMISNIVGNIHDMYKAKNFPPDAFYRGHFGDWSCSYCPVAEVCRKTWNLPIPESKRDLKPKFPSDYFIQKAKKGAAQKETK